MLQLIFILSLGAASADASQNKQAVSLMTFNVENLFDAKKDPDRNDHTYLPISKKSSADHIQACKKLRQRYQYSCLNTDWSEQVVKRKLKRVADVIQQVNQGRGPDILVLPEVENLAVLKQLNQQHLTKSAYKTVVLLEGPDKRGIDIGLLSRLEQAGTAQLHKIPFRALQAGDQEWMNKSRGILQVKLTLPDGKLLNVFGVHFPSPSNPTYWREQAIDFLNQLKAGLPKGELAVAMGDFNISLSEDQRSRLYQERLGETWTIGHEIGCQSCKGTNYYHRKRQWSFLDSILLDKAAEISWKIDPKTVMIPKQSRYQVSRFSTPARFSATAPVGVSDHWPLYAELRQQRQVE